MINLLKIALLFGSGVFAEKYLLTPKSHLFTVESFAQEHQLEKHVELDDFVIYSTNINNFNTFSNSFSDLFYVEKEQVYSVAPVEQSENQMTFISNVDGTLSRAAPWHLDRVTKRHLPLDGNYPYSQAGMCHTNPDVVVETYIVDTGIDVSHPEFEGRAEFLENFTDDGINTDGNSHGTHCAGIVGSKTYGVCKDAKLFGVKVLDSQGSGTNVGVMKGMEYAFKRHLQRNKEDSRVRSIMSMSLGGGYSRIMNTFIEKMATSSDTFYITVAAGNENQDACNVSPASARGIFTVMAMDRTDRRAYFSNHGQCSNIYAPGVNIQSTIPDGRTAVYSGTSQATPNVAGVLNFYLQKYPNKNMKQMIKQLVKDATSETISGNPPQTPNKMVYLEA